MMAGGRGFILGQIALLDCRPDIVPIIEIAWRSQDDFIAGFEALPDLHHLTDLATGFNRCFQDFSFLHDKDYILPIPLDDGVRMYHRA